MSPPISTPSSLPAAGAGSGGRIEAPFDPAALARLASAFFGALPGTPPTRTPTATLRPPGVPAGVQSPVDPAPPGSPLASPAGIAPSLPGTPTPAGIVPGTNLVPSSPGPLPSLANKAPALLPSAVAGNGAPDHALQALPAYEPRLGGLVQGDPRASAAVADTDPLDALARAPFAWPSVPSLASPPASAPSRPGAVPPTAASSRAGSSPAAASSSATGGSPYYFLTVPATTSVNGPTPASHYDVQGIRRDFPILAERVNGKPLVWLDNAATTHKPQAVIDRISHFYQHENSNIHRAAHALAARATDAYEGARETVRRFLNAPEANEVIFVRGTTEAINLVAKSWGACHVGAGHEIIVSHLEHHANIVPWQQLGQTHGARLRVIPVDDNGDVLIDEFRRLLNPRTKLVSVTQVSNALGTVVPVELIIELAHAAGVPVLVDGAQSVSHKPVDVQALGADFFVFSGHKIFAPTGIGALWARREVLETMPPWQGGGNMIADVTFEKTVFQPIPNTFEAGTGNIADAVGLGAALDYVGRIGLPAIARHEHDLIEHAVDGLRSIAGVRLLGDPRERAGVVSFVVDGRTTESVGRILDGEGIAVRTGHHCAQPILRRFGVETSVRPSFAPYNTRDEVDHLVSVVRRIARQGRPG